ncbi:MAG: cation:proton antiporter [Pyrinomonadaceae bacterium]
MHTPPLFAELLIILLVSVPVALLFLRLKMPLLVGFMLTGILIGPYGLGLIKELEAIELLAEIGVILLLFTIGIEFSIRRLLRMRNLVLIGGGLQVGITIIATAIISLIFGRQLNQSIFFGFLVALSSTAIVMKSYADRNEIDAPHGRAGVGILLFQDISIVLMMLFVPILGGKDALSFGAVAQTLGISLIALIVIVAAAWFLVPIILKQVVAFRSTEVLLLTAVLLSLGMAWVTSQFGLSLALGAFIAGIVLSESEYSNQVNADILPFRDVFNSIFFVSIGLLLSLAALIENLPSVILVVVLLISGKALIIWTAVRFLKFPHRISAMTALGLAQIGEFSFVLAKAGRGSALLPDDDYQIFIAATIISMIATPFLIAAAPSFGLFVQKFLKDKGTEAAEELEAEEIHLTSSGGLSNHVIIVGYGLNGRNLARVLRAVLVPYTILELNSETVRRAKKRGEKINFGDATRREVLRHAHIQEANALVLAMSDLQGTRRTVQQARELNKDLYIVVRTRYTAEITELLELGANEVIPEEFETSIEIFSRVLQRYGVARGVIENQIEEIRVQGYEMLRSPSLPDKTSLSNLKNALQAATTENVKVKSSSPVIGQTLAELDLRGKMGVTVIAVIEKGETRVNLGAEYVLKEDDTLIMLGDSERIEKVKKLVQPEKNKSPKT